MTKKITDNELERLSGGAVDVQITLTGQEKGVGDPPPPPPTGSNFGGNLMENTEQDHDADGR